MCYYVYVVCLIVCIAFANFYDFPYVIIAVQPERVRNCWHNCGRAAAIGDSCTFIEVILTHSLTHSLTFSLSLSLSKARVPGSHINYAILC